MKKIVIWITIFGLLLAGCIANPASAEGNMSLGSGNNYINLNDGPAPACNETVIVSLPKNPDGTVRKYSDGSLDVDLQIGSVEPKTLKPGEGTTIGEIQFWNFTHDPNVFKIKYKCL